jgi:glycosyltransferase involved in cell wall biosynthesis
MPTPAHRLRLGVYSDLVYRSDASGISTDRSFVNFITALSERVDEVVIFGRLDPQPGRSAHPVDGVRFVALPHYPSVFSIGQLVKAIPGSYRAFSAELKELDAVWLFGPAPLAVVFALVAHRHRMPVFLGVRQDYPQYIRNRLPGRSWAWAAGVAHMLDLAFQLVARKAPTVTIGTDLARRYRRGRAPVLPIALSLIRSDDILSPEEALARRWDEELRLLSVGRLDPEKNPLLLLDVIQRLHARDNRWRLAVAGEGPLADRFAREISARGLNGAVELLGYVASGPELWAQYRSSHAFLHVSLTEGLPQVLVEAEAAGLPIVATDVGGVGAALEHGLRGLLVPPRDAGSIVDALERLQADAKLREHLIRAGLDHAASITLDAQLEIVLRLFRDHMAQTRRSSSSPESA